jgi:hypothetical protein
MAKFEKGNKVGKGRPKGAENKIDKEVKTMFSEFMEGEVGKVKESFEKVREKDHAKYLELMSKYFPYFIAKKTETDNRHTFTDTPTFTLDFD